HRQQHGQRQYQPGRGLAPLIGFDPGQAPQPGAVVLRVVFPVGELLDQQHQQYHQKTHLSAPYQAVEKLPTLPLLR
ncbi:MAG TPA: hypothetical protein K8U95_10025, partial [Pseudomonas nitrititolerans]|nr:hypothetical protein [Stutzerimonas nitrititolerans]